MLYYLEDQATHKKTTLPEMHLINRFWSKIECLLRKRDTFPENEVHFPEIFSHSISYSAVKCKSRLPQG